MCDVWHWWDCTTSQSMGLNSGCALFWWILLFDLPSILLLVRHFIMIITNYCWNVYAHGHSFSTTDLGFLKLCISGSAISHIPGIVLPLVLFFYNTGLTHRGRAKMAAIFQTIFSNAFSWMKMYKFRWRFHWTLFPMIQLTISQHWFT